MATLVMALRLIGRLVNDVVSFVIFSALDVLDVFLCFVYKLADYALEAEWRPCYCSNSPKDMITSSGKILVSENGGSKVVFLCSSKLQLDDISDTLYFRPSLASEISRSTVRELRRHKAERGTTFTINSTIIEMLQEKIGGRQAKLSTCWSDCDCKTCSGWSSPGVPPRDTLFVRAEGATAPVEDVLFIHGFISSSELWTETVFPNFSEEARSKYRFIAIDLLGFGRSPKPGDSLYTLREHVDMIERSVLEPFKVGSFHIVAHSLGSILAIALAVKYPGAVKSLTLIAPPYFPVPKGEQGTQYVLRRVAPRRVWPMMAFGSSVACWYEHISRTICLLICKNHRVWEFIFKLVTRNRFRTFLMDGFFCHTHNAAWHTLHNIICGSGGKLDGYLDTVRDQLNCEVTVFHGSADVLLPVECSHAVKSKIPRANVKVVQDKDHITILVGREKTFARELEAIWRKTQTMKLKEL
ncbi:probable lysophospholipase BODYGUARD 1 [Dioscorea cayenensis subsp. rotundata]|uniref:Probable lysophospholipase BODYGUARD 1 n=1 Tax=Dioscorea cayennensis subsp. rotundata TaxID=55577 RepID=A0AB40B730_DIOCR|nr:probable lysophospholipase BODYGUARD 1 [Dioscorea cayenensis subsp. rotundata]